MSIARFIILTLLAAAGLLAPVRARAYLYDLPPGFTSDQVIAGLPFATGVAFAPDGRIFVALKSGVVRVWDGVLLPTPFLDISTLVGDAHDRGLIGIAVHPQFPQMPYVYLLFTYDPPGVIPDIAYGARVSRLIRVEADPAQGFNVALPGSDQPQATQGGPGHWVMLGTNSTLANIGNPMDGRDKSVASCMVGHSMANPPVEDCLPSDELTHSIGTVVFGTDGSLFVSNGDGSDSSSADPRAFRAFDLDSLAGKILHIDPATALGLPDNPWFVPGEPGRNRSKVYAYGLRNPFRMAINPANNDPYAGDVGSNFWEEINSGKAANFGWPCYEGGVQGSVESGVTTSLQQDGYAASEETSAVCAALYAQGLGAVKAPVFAYSHAGVDGFGGSGGATAQAETFYSGTTYPAEYQGALFMGEYNRLWIRYLKFDAQGVATIHNFGRATAEVVHVVQGPDTNLYAVLFNDTYSQVDRIRYVAGGNTPPTAVATATPSAGAGPLEVAFSGVSSFDPDSQPLDYSWNFGDGSPTSSLATPVHTYTASGTFTATLTVTEQSEPFASDTADVVITVGSVPPVAVISQPLDGTTFAIGETIGYDGGGTSGGAPLPPSALDWQLRIHHNEHVHYDDLPTPVPPLAGSFVAPDHADGIWFEICLTATDQTLSDTQCVDLLPRQTPVTVASNPLGMHVVYVEQGSSLTTPATVLPTEASLRTLVAPAVEQWLSFDRWLDGVTTRSRQFTAGAAPMNFTVLYTNLPPVAAGSANVASGPGRLSVPFDASGSSDPEGGALVYAWDYGDGALGSGPTPTHVYAAPGSYVATLTASDPVGGVSNDPVAVDIPNAAPLASLASENGPSLVVHFTAAGSSDPDGDPLSYAWNFGDGATATGASVSHTYPAAGSYLVTLGVADSFLATATAQQNLAVAVQAPAPACGIGPELAAAMAVLLGLRARRARR